MVSDGKAFANEVRANRRSGVISGEVNVSYHKKLGEVHIRADRGRVRKPYIIVEGGVSKYTKELQEKLKAKQIDFDYLRRNGTIEYLDAEEEENILAAVYESDITKKTTHLEIDPLSNLGLTANASIYPEHNSMGRHPMAMQFIKQSQGLFSINFNSRYDARAYMLYYPQLPMIDSITYRKLGLSNHPAGQNFIIATSTYFGYNMADAIVFNRAAIDRGLGRSVFYRAYPDEERRYPGGQQDHFKVPPPTADNYLGEHAYAKLGEDGIIEPGLDISEGEVLIGKTSPPRFLEEQTSFGVMEEKTRDSSITLRSGEEGTVDSVMLSETTGATKVVKVRVRSIKIPEIGDKFASRNAQKGVIGLIVNQDEMPFTEQGIVPDVLLNPHSIPGRMTLGHMLETIGAKAGALSGKRFDGTAFEKDGISRTDEYNSILEQHGFKKFGDESLRDGRTGERFNAEIFTGVVYYNKLVHMVSTKIQVRSRGPVQILTHQPTEGKPRRGGLRFGEMERDALVGHGASLLLKERMLDQSDKADIWVCTNCGDIGYYDYIKNTPVCLTCGSTSLKNVEISYAFKVLLDEIKSMHILPRIRLKG